MDNELTLRFTEDELIPIVAAYVSRSEEDIDLNDYSISDIKMILLDSATY